MVTKILAVRMPGSRDMLSPPSELASRMLRITAIAVNLKT
jgi:hypothetical protein